MQQVSDWLEKLGMAEYAQCFADNDIDFSILHELTDQDLEKIGVVSLGHRRRILKAIAVLNGPAAAAAQMPAPSAAEPAVVAPPEARIVEIGADEVAPLLSINCADIAVEPTRSQNMTVR